MKKTIVCGASENHARSLRQFLTTVPAFGIDAVYVWDFGMEESTVAKLKAEFPYIRLRVFDWSKYPAFFNIQVAAGEYAWKPVAIWEVAQECDGSGCLLWCDAGNMILAPLDQVFETIRTQGFYSPISSGTVGKWTHPGMLSYLGYTVEDTHSLLNLPPRNGAIVGFNLDAGEGRAMLEEWASLARIRECIAPPGSSRENHRQDQALLTLLYYRATGNGLLQTGNLGIRTHCDCD